MPHRHHAATLATAVALVCAVTLSGCAGGAPNVPAPTTAATTAPASGTPTPADTGTETAAVVSTDVEFAEALLPLVDEAREMASLALDPRHKASPQVKAAATEVRAVSIRRHDTLSGWLDAWSSAWVQTATPTKATDPATVTPEAPEATDTEAPLDEVPVEPLATDTAAATEGPEPFDMEQLGAASGPQFDTLWLTHMIDVATAQAALARSTETTGNTDVDALVAATLATETTRARELHALLTGATPTGEAATTTSTGGATDRAGDPAQAR